MSNFNFLASEWPLLYESANRAEALVHNDARTSCFYARRCLEQAVNWIYQSDSGLRTPYDSSLNSLIHEPTFKKLLSRDLFVKVNAIKYIGNQAVHSTRRISEEDSIRALRELFHFAYWLARTYTRTDIKTYDGLIFEIGQIPPSTDSIIKKSNEALRKLERELAEKDKNLHKALLEKKDIDVELEKLRQEIAKAKERNANIPDNHDYSEAETRSFFIDLLLREAGWLLQESEDREYPVTGMPTKSGKGFIDYVLWGDDGIPLGLVEAKRTTKDARIGQRQAELYANCLELEFGVRPIIFYTNGYETWLWDDKQYPPRRVEGFYTKNELELLIQRRTSKKDPSNLTVRSEIVERPYQIQAIRHVVEWFKESNRKALIVMATGSGKTRTVIALCDILQRANWVKRVLFLADRRALVRQAANAFKRHLPDSSPVNLLSEKEQRGSRVYVSTYPTMMSLIEDRQDEIRRFGPGYFDLIVVDEAHRSVYQKYKAIFEYFDGFLVGLTATPKDEVDRNTYGLFELEDGNPTFAYELGEAINEGYLVGPKSITVPVEFPIRGISYDERSEEEQEQWDMIDWDEDGDIPTRIEAAEVNDWFFNANTVDRVLETLVTKGLRVDVGDRLAKTIIFAKNHNHAVFIQERFDKHYPKSMGHFCRVIDNQEPYAESLLDEFSIADKEPHIAVSVDMLDTGVDVPEVANLVFFKSVWSKTKFFQMVGRGTRLCKNLFGPGIDKESFYIFDCCRNFEFFNQNPEAPDSALGEPVSTRLFKARLKLLQGIRCSDMADAELDFLNTDLTDTLHQVVGSMNQENFLVRKHLRQVEKYSNREEWNDLADEEIYELNNNIAKLPTQLPSEDATAKQFDLLILRLQLALLNTSQDFLRWQRQVREIASQLETKANIPMVKQQLELIQEIQLDGYWIDITIPMLEIVRKRIRELVKFIEKKKRKIVYADFEDKAGEVREVDSIWLGSEYPLEQYKKRVKKFLEDHIDHIAINKLKRNIAITETDIKELERLLFESGDLGGQKEFQSAFGADQSLGEFVRSMVGLEREAINEVFADYLEDTTYNAKQIQFIRKIVDYLAINGKMDPGTLYEPPFTDINSGGLDAVFNNSDADKIVSILRMVNNNASVDLTTEGELTG